MRDAYAPDDPGFLAWQTGARPDPAGKASWWGTWHDHVAEATRRGVAVRRARIVSEPVSDYVRYEHDLTFGNLAAGEQVRWLPRRQTTDLALPGTDFWVFDDELVLFHHFSGEGNLAPDGREHVRDAQRAKACTEAFEAVWRRAIPHSEYHPA
ncbi:hypothetical protein JE024_40555 (plasmid) [Streptomyces zhihengii]|uniref:DUF6879 domain-containing protein n=2 Tax=Streptomyces zhihengii TaxID=1818004 RepID=A0ABS2V6P4_9ACTN|nr:DUF6879 family protein [Streptomyces zhihengii]MBM9624813.1 hypothetical protein [Streptomyces zhihengii]